MEKQFCPAGSKTRWSALRHACFPRTMGRKTVQMDSSAVVFLVQKDPLGRRLKLQICLSLRQFCGSSLIWEHISLSFPKLWRFESQHFQDAHATKSLQALTSLNKESRPFLLGDNSIWILSSVSFLSDYSIWRSRELLWPCDESIWSIWAQCPQIRLSLRKNGQREPKLLNFRRFRVLKDCKCLHFVNRNVLVPPRKGR